MIDLEAKRRQDRQRIIAKARDETDEFLSAASWKLASEFAYVGLPALKGSEIMRAWFDSAREALKHARDEAEEEVRRARED